MEPRKQFTFYRSYFEAVKKLPKRVQTDVLLAVCDYGLNGTEPKLTGTAEGVFILIRPTLDAGRKKAESGKRGGQSCAPETEPRPYDLAYTEAPDYQRALRKLSGNQQ